MDECKPLTWGAHAVLLFSQMCDSISLYGFTTFATTKAGLRSSVRGVK